jgi:hypothetical protein
VANERCQRPVSRRLAWAANVEEPGGDSRAAPTVGVEAGVAARVAGVEAAAGLGLVAWTSPVALMAGVDEAGVGNQCGVGGSRCGVVGRQSRRRPPVVVACRWAADQAAIGGERARWAAAGEEGEGGTCLNLSKRVRAGAHAVDRVQLIYVTSHH